MFPTRQEKIQKEVELQEELTKVYEEVQDAIYYNHDDDSHLSTYYMALHSSFSYKPTVAQLAQKVIKKEETIERIVTHFKKHAEPEFILYGAKTDAHRFSQPACLEESARLHPYEIRLERFEDYKSSQLSKAYHQGGLQQAHAYLYSTPIEDRSAEMIRKMIHYCCQDHETELALEIIQNDIENAKRWDVYDVTIINGLIWVFLKTRDILTDIMPFVMRMLSLGISPDYRFSSGLRQLKKTETQSQSHPYQLVANIEGLLEYNMAKAEVRVLKNSAKIRKESPTFLEAYARVSELKITLQNRRVLPITEFFHKKQPDENPFMERVHKNLPTIMLALKQYRDDSSQKSFKAFDFAIAGLIVSWRKCPKPNDNHQILSVFEQNIITGIPILYHLIEHNKKIGRESEMKINKKPEIEKSIKEMEEKIRKLALKDESLRKYYGRLKKRTDRASVSFELFIDALLSRQSSDVISLLSPSEKLEFTKLNGELKKLNKAHGYALNLKNTLKQFMEQHMELLEEFFFRVTFYLLDRINKSRTSINSRFSEWQQLQVQEERLMLISVSVLNLVDASWATKPDNKIFHFLEQTCNLAMQYRQIDLVVILVIAFHRLEYAQVDARMLATDETQGAPKVLELMKKFFP